MALRVFRVRDPRGGRGSVCVQGEGPTGAALRVFRVNGAVIRGFERDVGTRTSFYGFTVNTLKHSLVQYRRDGFTRVPRGPVNPPPSDASPWGAVPPEARRLSHPAPCLSSCCVSGHAVHLHPLQPPGLRDDGGGRPAGAGPQRRGLQGPVGLNTSSLVSVATV